MTIFVEARCQCGLNAFNLTFPTASLPMPNIIYYCNTCRYISGQLARDYASVQGVPLSPATGETADSSTLATYNTTEHVTRWFCGTCFANMFATHSALPDWYVSVGILRESDGIVSSKAHVWVSDTLDGDWLITCEQSMAMPSQGITPGRRRETWREMFCHWNGKGPIADQEHDHPHVLPLQNDIVFHYSSHHGVSPPILPIPRPRAPLPLDSKAS